STNERALPATALRQVTNPFHTRVTLHRKNGRTMDRGGISPTCHVTGGFAGHAGRAKSPAVGRPCFAAGAAWQGENNRRQGPCSAARGRLRRVNKRKGAFALSRPWSPPSPRPIPAKRLSVRPEVPRETFGMLRLRGFRL